jgi:hypothetical protein
MDLSVPVASHEHTIGGKYDPTPGSIRKGKVVSNVYGRALAFIEYPEMGPVDDPWISNKDHVLATIKPSTPVGPGGCEAIWFDDEAKPQCLNKAIMYTDEKIRYVCTRTI